MKCRSIVFAAVVPPVKIVTGGTSRSMDSFLRSVGMSLRSSPAISLPRLVFFTVVARSGARKRFRCFVIFGRRVRAAVSFLSDASSTGTTTSLSTWMTGTSASFATRSRHCRWMRR